MHQSVEISALSPEFRGLYLAERDTQFSEDIRLVIWDLDETFWDGTLTEGVIRYRQDHHQLVIDLAQRGIMSTICSKSDHYIVERYLRVTGLWEYFVFPSINWSPKGPRIKAMLQRLGLRASSVLFLDDNAMNLAQAAHTNPGLNVALPVVIEALRDADRLCGKPDPELTRLAQYKLKERKHAAQEAVQGDPLEFLRQSDVKAFIEYDIEAHVDHAVELINRTNHLNFTKQRLPDDPQAAREALLMLLAHNTTDAGLIRVRDDYGDYGFVGFYLTQRRNNQRTLVHFCFSYRILNMYVEHWLYDFLGRPALDMAGDVLSNPLTDQIRPDWITPAHIDAMDTPAQVSLVQFDYIFARGGCDLASLMHYFALYSGKVIEEFDQPQNGQMFRRDHTSFLMPALGGLLNDAQLRAAAGLGYQASDFESSLPALPEQNALYVLNFSADADIPIYRHKESGLRVPYWLVGAQHHDLIARDDLRDAVACTDAQRERLQFLAEEFECEGLLDATEMRARYKTVLDHLPRGAPIAIVLANERGPMHYQNADKPPHQHHVRLNEVLRGLVKTRSNVMLIDPADYIDGPEDLIDLNHFKRPVYHRMYRDVLAKLANWTVPTGE